MNVYFQSQFTRHDSVLYHDMAACYKPWSPRSRQETLGVATFFYPMTTISRHVNNGYISVSHFVCVECELTPEKIGAWSRVPDSSQNERASPQRPCWIYALRVPAIARGAILAFLYCLCWNTRPYLDQKRPGQSPIQATHATSRPWQTWRHLVVSPEPIMFSQHDADGKSRAHS
jgi:hypothetical protein